MTNALATAAGHFPDSSDRPAASPPGFRVAHWFAALSDAAGRRYLLLLRFVVINLVATALFCAAWLKGWVDMILAGDSTHQVVLIAVVFAYGLVRCGGKIFWSPASRSIRSATRSWRVHLECRSISRASTGMTPSRGRSAPRPSR